MDCLRAPLYNTCRICFDSGTEQYEAFNDNSSLKPIPTNTYRGGIVLYVDTDLNDLKYSNIQIILSIQNYHESNKNINIWRKIFKYLNIFEYSFEH